MVILFEPGNLGQIRTKRRPFGRGVLPPVSGSDRAWAAQVMNADARDYDVMRPLDAITDDNLITPEDEEAMHLAGRECERGRA
jgi:hypothetical protein